MRKFVLSIFAVLLLSVQLVMAQSQVKGTVTSNDGSPLPGVTVLLKGTHTATATNNAGQFTLNGASNGTLVFSFIGMETQEVFANNKTTVDVTMAADAKMIEDVIVVAYGTARKESFSGSAEVIKADKLEKRTVANITKALDGQVTGLQTTSGSGQPGSGSSVVIRGFGSINASNQPLYVVDGVPYNGDIAALSPSDIESLTVLKDASAGALYGARGANGIIMITTKKGTKTGSPKVSFKGTFGLASRAIPRYETVNEGEFVQLAYESAKNKLIYNGKMDPNNAAVQAITDMSNSIGGEKYNPFNMPYSQLIDPLTGSINPTASLRWSEDWMDAMTTNAAPRQEYQLSVMNGNDKQQMMFSLGYLNEDGVLKNTNFKRYSGRVNYDAQIKHWVKGGLGASFSHSNSNSTEYDGTSMANVWYSAQFMGPIYPVYMKDANGQNALDGLGNKQFDYGKGRPAQSNFNSIATLYDDKFYKKRDNLSARSYFTFGTDREDAGWIKDFRFSVNFGLDYYNTNSMEYYNPNHGNFSSVGGIIQKSNNRMLSYTLNQLLTYTKQLGKHNIDVLAGHEYYDYGYSYLAAGKNGLINGMYEVRPGSTLNVADSYSHKYTIESYLSRLNYNFDNKYYFSASFRTDASSRFHTDNRWGNFWSVGGSWRVSQENFLKDVSWIDNLTVKASYGVQGNDNLLDSDGNSTYYAWQSLYDLNFSNSNMNGAIISSLENKDLTWEKNANFNTGFEARLFGRLDISLEWYRKKTSDLLLSFPMALSTGFGGYNANVGSMLNSGFEVSISGMAIDSPNFTWRPSIMLSTVKNKILKLADKPEIIRGITVLKEGMPINSYYMSKSAGVDPMTGNQLYWVYDKDKDGNMKGEPYISDDYSKAATSKFYQGSRIPKFYGSFGSDFTFLKNFDFSFLTTYSVGGKIYEGNYNGLMNVSYIGDTWSKHAMRRWNKPGDITDVPRIETGRSIAANNNYLVDASYFAIKNITLGYTLPTSILRKAGIDQVRVFATVDNAILFTHLKGMDPQYNFSGSTDYAYAPIRTISMGIDLKF